MKRHFLFTLSVAVVSLFIMSSDATAREHHHHRHPHGGRSTVYFNFSYPWYPHRYYYVAPPPVVYAAPTYYAPPPVYYPPAAVTANQISPTFVDGYGRTCRQFESTPNGATGTACLQPDGTWRVVY